MAEQSLIEKFACRVVRDTPDNSGQNVSFRAISGPRLRSGRLAGLFLSCGHLAVLACAQAWAGSDAPVSAADNRTKVTTGQNGRTTVQIAPVEKGGMSHNRYIRFDVPAAGVDLDNRQRKARIILNEVVSTKRSRLNAAIEEAGYLAMGGQIVDASIVLEAPRGIAFEIDS